MQGCPDFFDSVPVCPFSPYLATFEGFANGISHHPGFNIECENEGMDRPASLSVRNRGPRLDTGVNSAGVELRNIPPSGRPSAESVSNISVPNGHTEIQRESSSIHRTRDFTENDLNNSDARSEVTVVPRSLRTWDVAALIINKMVRFQKVQFQQML